MDKEEPYQNRLSKIFSLTNLLTGTVITMGAGLTYAFLTTMEVSSREFNLLPIQLKKVINSQLMVQNLSRGECLYPNDKVEQVILYDEHPEGRPSLRTLFYNTKEYELGTLTKFEPLFSKSSCDALKRQEKKDGKKYAYTSEEAYQFLTEQAEQIKESNRTWTLTSTSVMKSGIGLPRSEFRSVNTAKP